MKADYAGGIAASYNGKQVDKEYEYIRFVKKMGKPKTSVWTCENIKSGYELGTIKWHGPWRQYCFFVTAPAVYSAGCHEDIADFIRKAMEARA